MAVVGNWGIMPGKLTTATAVHRQMRSLRNASDAIFLQRFFKTGKGQYAEGDRFLGIRVPATRKVAAQCAPLPLEELATLLQSEWHEERLLALILLCRAFAKGDEAARKAIYSLYLANTRHINNWDLVDSSAGHIVGSYLQQRPREPLYKLAKSKSLWERRIAIIATYHFIKQGDAADTLALAQLLLCDEHDLIHKAAGWMLREVGQRVSPAALEQFLQQHAPAMPRTMLRYAIEHLPPADRRRYMDA